MMTEMRHVVETTTLMESVELAAKNLAHWVCIWFMWLEQEFLSGMSQGEGVIEWFKKCRKERKPELDLECLK